MSTPNLNLPEIAASQSQKHITHNEALGILDAVVNLSVLSQSVTSDPASPDDGARYLVPAGAAGAFAGHDGTIASYRDGVWTFYIAAAGWRAYVADEGGFAVHDGTNWRGPDPSLISLTPNGAESRIVTVEEELSLSGASVSSTTVIPNRAVVFGVSTLTTEDVTGVWQYHCGISGQPEKFGGYLGIAAGSNNAGVIGPEAFYADTPVVITAHGDTGVFAGGKVRIALHYFLPVVPQS